MIFSILRSTRFPYTTLFRSLFVDRFPPAWSFAGVRWTDAPLPLTRFDGAVAIQGLSVPDWLLALTDRKSTRLNSSHRCRSYAGLCLKKKNKIWRHEHIALRG